MIKCFIMSRMRFVPFVILYRIASHHRAGLDHSALLTGMRTGAVIAMLKLAPTVVCALFAT